MVKLIPNKQPRQAKTTWTSYWTFLIAIISSSIGLGNIWKFPYEMGSHGGGTFLIVYLPCLLLVALPVMMSEIMIGRYGRSDPVHGAAHIARQERISSLWQIMGWLAMLGGFLVFTYYSVVGGWILYYIMHSASGSFVDVPAEIVQSSFSALLQDTDQLIIWHTVFVLMVVAVLARGLRAGLERALYLLMPCFAALVIWLCLYASQVGDFNRALEFVFTYDLQEIDAELIVSALTQALFSLSIGLGALIMYGAYIGEQRPIATAATVVMILDTAIALVMGLLIFSIVFAFEMRPDSGAGLIFETLPVAFSQMTRDSVLWSTLFFTLFATAALSSAFALLEPLIVWMVRHYGMRRRYAALLVGSLAWGGGILSIYSFNELKYSFYYFGEERLNGTFDLLNILTMHLLMPLTALLVTIFAGWRISQQQSREALAIPIDLAYRLWRLCVRVLAPVILIAALLIVLAYPV